VPADGALEALQLGPTPTARDAQVCVLTHNVTNHRSLASGVMKQSFRDRMLSSTEHWVITVFSKAKLCPCHAAG
jgi:hypothetical protein